MSAEIGPIPETEFQKPKSKFVKLSSIRNSKSKGGEDEKKKQIQDYVVWVNSYLKTRPGIPLISDLKGGMQDGISLVNVVESAANAEIPFIIRKPTSSSTRKSNIEKAIAFLKSDGAIFAGDPVKDINDGNIKGIMKIILVIAEKYNPRSVRPIEQKLSTSTTSSSSSHHHMPSGSQPLSVPTTAGRSPERMRSSNNNSNALSTSPGRGLSPIPQSHPLPHVPHRQSNPQPHSQSHSQSHPQPLPQPHSQTHSHPHSQPHSQPYPRSHSQSNAHFQSYPQSQPSQTQTQSHPHHSHHFNGTNVPLQGYALSQGFAMSQNFGPSMGGGFGMAGDTTDDAVVTGGPGGYSLSQPVGGAQQQQQPSEDIYTDPIDSLPKNVTQRISSQMPGNRVIGQKLPPKVHNRLSVPSGKTNPGGSSQQHSPAATATENIVIKEAPVVPAESKQETTQKPQDNTLIYGEVNGALSGLGELKIELLKLHTVLLDNVGDSETSEASKIDMKLPMEVANSEIMTKDKEIGELQEEIEKSKAAFTKLESECDTLKEMVMERNQFITGMKTEIYRKEYRNDTEKVDLQTQLLHKDRKIKILEGEINLMKASVEGKEREMVEIRKKRAESETKECEYQEEVAKIQSELARAIEAEEALQAKLFSRDRKISHLEEKLEHERGFLQRVNPSVVSEDMDSVREMLVSLRESMEPGDTNQQTLDKLEKNISTMITKFTDHVRSISPGRKPPRRHHDERRDEKKKRHRDRGESRSSRDEVFERPYHSPSSTTGEWTKVFYYITGDKMETPYCTSVPRKASEVRLKDFKAVFDRHGSYRFYFKTEDPDCGVVREEIINDEHILPAWNGKIMVWVTEKAHHHR